MDELSFISYKPSTPATDPADAARQFYETLRQRRSVRLFSDRPIPREVIEDLIRAAGTASVDEYSPVDAADRPLADEGSVDRAVRAAAHQQKIQAAKARAEGRPGPKSPTGVANTSPRHVYRLFLRR
ncbi:MAG: nitroreductase family protein [Planctomycetota bacterium]|nr:nitroreductase family protein [Planctomycetota bacterium]